MIPEREMKELSREFRSRTKGCRVDQLVVFRDILQRRVSQAELQAQQAGSGAQALPPCPLPTLDEILNCYSPDDTVGDYQDKIRALFGVKP
ncbi:MAG: hypothetical protein DI543_03185 [Bradyrhizobium icense]|nr:MAG: hypothetical protein DI543_03185 [Bradyrhizobium icense]